MARKRMISPELFTSETVSALPIPTRYTWVGILCYLDDFGIGRNNPALIKAAVWPLDDSYTSRKVAADVSRLVGLHMLCAYACCDNKYVHAPNWELWQKISHPTPTKLCPCPGHHRDASRIHRRDSGATPELFGVDSGAVPRNVIESKLVQENVSGDAADQPLTGSAAIAGIREQFKSKRASA